METGFCLHDVMKMQSDFRKNSSTPLPDSSSKWLPGCDVSTPAQMLRAYRAYQQDQRDMRLGNKMGHREMMALQGHQLEQFSGCQFSHQYCAELVVLLNAPDKVTSPFISGFLPFSYPMPVA
jgi:hypothetical protein